jgi:hypothetical protein
LTSVLVAGALANKPGYGGEAWVRLSYALGFRALGLETSFVEEIEEPTDEAVGYFAEVVERFGLAASAALVDSEGEPLYGEPPEPADLLVNVSGNLRCERLLRQARRRAYVDIDPGFTQIWKAQGLLSVDHHDVYFTIGENIGRPGCPIPTGGTDWRPTRPPVVLSDWPVAANGVRDRFTTVASWRGGYGSLEFEGTRYGAKAHEFRKFVELPGRAPGTFEVALDIHPAEAPDLALLRDHGWELVDPRHVARDPLSFREYVQGSGAEFSVAQGIYVETESGWFSDRTVRYLASGKPALVQDTGFTRTLPAGEGLLAFRTLEEAAAGAGEIARDYERHSIAARRLAEDEFDSKRVLTRLLEDALP